MKKLQVLICALILLSLLIMPLSGCTKPLTLAVSEPTEGAILTKSPVEVRGTVSDTKATVRVNNVKVSSRGGSFSHNIYLTEGQNIIRVVATQGKKSVTSSLTVTYRPEKTPPVK